MDASYQGDRSDSGRTNLDRGETRVHIKKSREQGLHVECVLPFV